MNSQDAFPGTDRKVWIDHNDALRIEAGMGQVVIEPGDGQVIVEPGKGQVIVEPGDGQVIIKKRGSGQIILPDKSVL